MCDKPGKRLPCCAVRGQTFAQIMAFDSRLAEKNVRMHRNEEWNEDYIERWLGKGVSGSKIGL